MKGLKNGKVYVDGKGMIPCSVAFENGVITAIGEAGEDFLDVSGYSVLPGFIDEHIHGAAGSDAMDGTVEALSTIAKAIASEGTTSFLATTMTQSPENIMKAMNGVKAYRGEVREDGAEVIGVHLEGPFISKIHVGAQPIEYVVEPSVEVFKKYNDACGNCIKIVSMAVEEPHAAELISYLKSKEIVASIGHSDAKYADVEAAVALGAGSVTHTYNAQRPIHHREIGVPGSAMLIDSLNAEIIADTIHVSVPAIKLLAKNKPKNKLTLITDAMRAKHMPDGISELGGQTVYVKNGEARLINGALAGSVLKMNDAIKNMVQKVGLSFTDAVDCATKNPAQNIGMFDKIGSITIGKRANFAVMNDNYQIVMTIRDGNIIYKA